MTTDWLRIGDKSTDVLSRDYPIRQRSRAKKFDVQARLAISEYGPSIFPSSFLSVLIAWVRMPAFTRSIVPFLRTARAATQQRNAVSPLHHALKRGNGVDSMRMYAAAFERTKPHVNIGMIGISASVFESSQVSDFN